MRLPLFASRSSHTGILVSILTVIAVALSPLALSVPRAEAARNRPPQLRAIPTQVVHAGHLLKVRPRASDPDHGPRKLRFSAAGRPGWLKLNKRTGVLTGRPATRLVGRQWRVTLRVSDGRASRSRTFKVRVRGNRPPRLAPISDRNVRMGDELIVTPAATDPDRGPRALRYSVSYTPRGDSPREPSWLSLDRRSGFLVGTAPGGSAGDRWRVTLAVSDGQKVARRSFDLTVLPAETHNSAPVVEDQRFEVDEGRDGAAVGRVRGTDADGDRLTWSLRTAGVPFAIDATGGLTTTRPLDHESRPTYELTVTASDGTASTDATVTVAVRDVDESPVLDPIPDVTTDEDAELDPIRTSATDPEGRTVTTTVSPLPAGLRFAAGTGVISGVPTVPGDYPVTVTATDGAGNSASRTFVIHVRNVNDAPVIADQAFSVRAGSARGTGVGKLVATDEDGDALTFASGSTDFAVAADGTVTVAAASTANGAGPYTFRVEASDGSLAAQATVTVSVTRVDRAPQFTGDPYAFAVDEDAAQGRTVGTVTATDADGDAITYAITSGDDSGVLAIDPATGAITVAAALDHETTGRYDLVVRATAGGESDEAVATVTVRDVNEAPSVRSIPDHQGTEDTAIDAIPVLTGDPDVGDTVRVSVSGLPAGLGYADGRITGTPTVPGSFRIVVTATDGGGLTGSTAFTLAVANVNDAPVIAPVDDLAATEDEAITPVVVAVTDADGDDVALALSPLPAGLTWDPATRTLAGTPVQSGDFSVTVTADDGQGGTASDTFAITVANVNDAPVIGAVTPASVSGTVGEPLEVRVGVGATDEDGDPLELTVTGLPDGLSATDNGDGTLTISGTPTAAGDSTATVTASDPEGASDTADLAVSIAEGVTACSPRSVLPCADVPVDLPVHLAFDGSEGGLADTGFTMVDPPSHRDNTDQAPAPALPTYPDVPGYEPSLLDVASGQLAVTATKGIMYSHPDGVGSSTETNSQLNALGVAVSGSTGGYEVDSTMVAPTFPGGSNGSQQGGTWFGLGEDDFVKAAVVRTDATHNKVQLVTEEAGTAAPATVHELNSAPFAAGEDVRLVMRVEDTPGDGGVVSLQYAVGGASLVQLTDSANTVDSRALPVPQAVFAGTAVGDGTDPATFTGVFATKRRAPASDDVVVRFAGFDVRAVTPADTTAPAAPSGVRAQAGTGSVELTWDANDEADLAGYRVYRSSSAGVPTDGTPVSGATPITETSFTDTAVTGGREYHYVVVAVDRDGNASAASTEVTATPPAAPEVHEKYVFQPGTPTAGQTTPAGYTRNDGSAWTDASGIGWVTQASLADTTHVPLDLTRNTRFRNRPGISALQNSLIHLQYGDIVPAGTTGTSTAGAFERAVPDGWYAVTVSVGDQPGGAKTGCPAPCYDSQHTVNVEGTTVIDRFQPTATSEYRSATTTVHVVDGRLTVDARGGTNTKVNYLELDSTEAPTEPDVHAKVRFSDEASTPPAGYVEDFGEAYGPRTGTDQGTGLTYGWRALFGDQPVSLVGNGRNRLTTTPAAPAGTSELAAGLMHMQLPANAAQGVTTPGYWEMAVPNGTYAVAVSAGDATAVDSDHWLNIEDQNAIAHFVPTGANGAATHWAEATRTVTVADGRLTITPTGGTNTKINWVTIDSVPGASVRPSVRTPHPANLATGVDPATTSVVSDLRLPNGGVEGASLTAQSVRLTRVSDGAVIPSGAATSGGSDTINLSPTEPLDPNTLYRFELTADATDITGAHFLPYSLVFTTGAGSGTGGPVAFDKVDSGAPKGAMYTSLVKGPDGKMYAGSITGQIYRFDIAADGALTNRQTITTVQDYSSAHDTYHPGLRTVIGMAFDPASTATNPILWITDNAPFLGVQDVPQFSGRLARLSGADLQTYQAVLTGLPRSVKDHETNSAAFGPDGALYFNQGADNAMGRADGTWRNRPETVLTAAVLRLDPSRLPAAAQLPVDVQTEAFDGAAGDVTGSNGPKKNSGPYYDPYAAGAPLTVYAMGTRNAFDLVWHSNGHLYTPTNGSAAGGNTPAVPSPLPASCSRRPDGGYTGGPAPAITGNPTAETDYVFDVKPGGYYGHPNPQRCEYVLAGGNPTAGTDPFEVPSYPVGTAPDPRLNLADVYDAGLHASANGAIEYKGGAFGGALNGKLLYVRYSSGQDLVSFDVNRTTGRLSNRTSIVTGLAQPLDVAEDDASGNLYVTQLTDNGANTSIVLLKPQGGGGGPVAAVTDRLVLSGPTGATSRSVEATVENTGVDDLQVTGATLGGANPGQFRLVSPPAFPVTLTAGQSLKVAVAFAPTSVGIKTATLDLATAAGARSVRLRGLAAAGLGGSNEPSLQQIMDAYEIPIDVGDTTSSSTGLIGDEVRAQLFEKAADDSPISITPIAVYGPQNSDPAVTVGWYEAGNGSALHEQFTVKAADAQGLMINPTGTTADIDPGSGPFGLYSDWPYFNNRKAYTEDALNTWDAAHTHHVRAYPLERADGSAVPNAYVLATEEVPGSTFDTQDIVLVVRNVKPTVPAAPNARVALQNLDGVPYDDRLSFSRIQTPNTSTSTTQRTHDTAQVRVTNAGSEAMQVVGLPVSGPFELVDAPTLPFAVAAGGSTTLTVRFTATTGDVRTGNLQVVTNAGTNGSPTVQLAGFWQSQSENGQEPSVREMAQVFGYTTNIPANLNGDGAVVALGDEVLSPYWKAVDATRSVTVRQLASFHTFPNQATAYWHAKGSTSTTKLTDINTAWAQSILPPRSGSTAPATPSSFSPGAGTFGFKIDGEWSDDTRNNQSADQANGCAAPCGHHVRFFPVKDRTGATVAGQYLMTMDYSGINYDYNDNVYLISNIKPEVPAAPRDVAASAGDGRVTLTWSAAAEPGVQYNVWRSTTATVATTGPALNAAPLSSPSYVDTTVTNGTTYYYVVKAAYPGGASSAASAAVAAVPVSSSAYQLKVNFQTKAAAAPAGYVKDYGSAYASRTDAGQGTGNAYGWVVPGTHTGLDLSVGGTNNLGNGRVRGVDADPRTDSFMHMQGDDVPNFNGTAAEGAWELAVPDGRYTVTLVVGDAKVGSDPESHEINVEGVEAVHAFVPTGGDGSPGRHTSATLTVQVADGRLTIDALGGTNTKIDYVDVVGVG